MGILDFFYNLGGQVGQAAYQAGASVTKPQASQPSYTPPPEIVAPSSNPVSQATQYYNERYNVTTPGYQSASQPIQMPVQSIQSAPAQRFDPVKGISEGLGGVSKLGGDVGAAAFRAGSDYGASFKRAYSPTPELQQVAMPALAARARESPIDFAQAPSFAQQTIAQRGDTGITAYVPQGENRQLPIRDVKMVYGETGGAVGFMETPKSIYENEGFTRKYGFVTSSGGPGALQSGMFSLAPLTPAVMTRESGGTKFAPEANVPLATELFKNPAAYSRLGAEAYGGYVQPLDNRTLQPGTEMGRYPVASGNLANLVNPYGVNQPKENWETIPWAIEFQGAPNIQRVDLKGGLFQPTPEALGSIGMKPSQNIPMQRTAFDIGSIRGEAEGGKGIGLKAAPMGVYDAGQMGMPVPFRSPGTDIVTVTKPTGALPYIGELPLISPALAFFQQGEIKSTSKSTTIFPTETTIGQPTSITRDLGGGTFETLTTTPITTKQGSSTIETTTITPLPSGYETFEKGVSEKYVKPFTPDISKETFGTYARTTMPFITIPGDIGARAVSLVTGKKEPSMSEVLGGMYYGQYQGVREKPVQMVAAVGMGAVLGAGFKALDTVSAVGATGAVGAYPTTTAVLTGLNTRYLPMLLGGVYATDIGIRSTKGLTDYEPTRVAERFGGITSTEALPMIAGGMAGYKATDWVLSRIPQLTTVPGEAGIIAGAKPNELAPTKATLDIYKNINRVESPLKNAPDFGRVSGVQKTPEITGMIKGQEHSVFGRTTEIGQMPKEWIEARGTTKDIDIFVNKPTEFGREIYQAHPAEFVPKGAEDFTALMSKRTGQTALDIHPFPEGYPIGKKGIEPQGEYVKGLVNPTPSRGGIYEAEGITSEKLFVQARRKATSVLGEDVGQFGPPEHRMKDVGDLMNYASYLSKETGGYRKAKLESGFNVLKEYYQRPEVFGKYQEGAGYAKQIGEMSFGKPTKAAEMPKFTGREDVSFSSVPRSVPSSVISVSPAFSFISSSPTTKRSITTTSSLSSELTMAISPASRQSRSSQISSILSTTSRSSMVASTPTRSESARSSTDSAISSLLGSSPISRSGSSSRSMRSESGISGINQRSFDTSFGKATGISKVTGSKTTTSSKTDISISPSYSQITKTTILPGGFGLPGGSDVGRQRGRSKSPFREMINIESQLFGGKKKRRKS
jgi:hypothetical protein